MKLSTDTGKKPYDRIKEHVGSNRHKRLKTETEETKHRQPSIDELLARHKRLEEQQEGAIYDLIHSICLCGLSIHNTDGPIGKFIVFKTNIFGF